MIGKVGQLSHFEQNDRLRLALGELLDNRPRQPLRCVGDGGVGGFGLHAAQSSKRRSHD